MKSYCKDTESQLAQLKKAGANVGAHPAGVRPGELVAVCTDHHAVSARTHSGLKRFGSRPHLRLDEIWTIRSRGYF
jgi:hypothetical protein